MGSVNRNFPRHLQRCAGLARRRFCRDAVGSRQSARGLMTDDCRLMTVDWKSCRVPTDRSSARPVHHRGREKDRYFRRVSVSVTTTLARPPEIARAAALAFRSLRNNPNTADPLPDIAA